MKAHAESLLETQGALCTGALGVNSFVMAIE